MQTFQNNYWHQTTDPGSSEHIKDGKYPVGKIPRHIFKLGNQRQGENLERSQRGGKPLSIEEQG